MVLEGSYPLGLQISCAFFVAICLAILSTACVRERVWIVCSRMGSVEANNNNQGLLKIRIDSSTSKNPSSPGKKKPAIVDEKVEAGKNPSSQGQNKTPAIVDEKVEAAVKAPPDDNKADGEAPEEEKLAPPEHQRPSGEKEDEKHKSAGVEPREEEKPDQNKSSEEKPDESASEEKPEHPKEQKHDEDDKREVDLEEGKAAAKNTSASGDGADDSIKPAASAAQLKPKEEVEKEIIELTPDQIILEKMQCTVASFAAAFATGSTPGQRTLAAAGAHAVLLEALAAIEEERGLINMQPNKDTTNRRPPFLASWYAKETLTDWVCNSVGMILEIQVNRLSENYHWSSIADVFGMAVPRLVIEPALGLIITLVYMKALDHENWHISEKLLSLKNRIQSLLSTMRGAA